MDNKLSELSKPVGFVSDRASTQLKEGSPASIRPFFDVQGSKPLYSQEYVSALLAELEASSLQCRGIEQERELFRVERTAHQLHAQALEQRIAELEAIKADASEVFKEIGNELGCNPDNESIMMAIDELKATQMTGPLKDVLKRNIELEAKLNHYVAAEHARASFDQTADIIKRADDAEREVEELRTKLATPVRLKKVESSNVPFAGDGFNAAVDYCAKAVRAAGFKCMGDEQ